MYYILLHTLHIRYTVSPAFVESIQYCQNGVGCVGWQYKRHYSNQNFQHTSAAQLCTRRRMHSLRPRKGHPRRRRPACPNPRAEHCLVPLAEFVALVRIPHGVPSQLCE